jgi:hypothetical protein
VRVGIRPQLLNKKVYLCLYALNMIRLWSKSDRLNRLCDELHRMIAVTDKPISLTSRPIVMFKVYGSRCQYVTASSNLKGPAVSANTRRDEKIALPPIRPCKAATEASSLSEGQLVVGMRFVKLNRLFDNQIVGSELPSRALELLCGESGRDHGM